MLTAVTARPPPTQGGVRSASERRLAVWSRRQLRRLPIDLLDLIAPTSCCVCGRSTSEVCCSGCAARLRRLPPAGLGCLRCGEPLWQDGHGVRCGASHRRYTGLESVTAAFRYIGVGGDLVRRLKFARDLRAGELLARAMAAQLASIRDDTRRSISPRRWRRAVLVPVPLHPARRRRRGFDQSLWLADAIGARLRMEVAPVLERIRATLPQGDPRVLSRERNVAGALRARRRASALRGRLVVVVDDVSTSGATARAAAEALRGFEPDGVVLATAVRSRTEDAGALLNVAS